MSKMYRDPSLNDGRGGDRPVQGNSVGPFVVLADPNTGDPIGLLDPDTGAVSAFIPVALMDSEQRVPGMVGYVGPTVQSGATKIISPTVTVSADAYTAGDCVGGKLTLSDAVRVSGGAGVLQNITVLDVSNTKPAFEILIFNANPTAATLTDQSAIALSTDVGKVIHRIPVYTSDYTTVAGVAIASVNVGKVVQAVGSTNLYATIAATAAHDLTATTDITLHVGFLQD